MTIAISTSADGQWIAIRRDREVALFATGTGEHPAGPAGTMELPTDDCDIALVGPVLAAVVRGDAANRVMLYEPPSLEAVARHDLEAPAHVACVTGPRLVLVGADGKHVAIVRAAPRAISAQVLDVPGAIEFAVGLEKNQLLLSLQKKLEVWDSISGRPVLRLQLQLPLPPRTVGAAQGHLWATRPNSDEVFVYRLSDGRPFRHFAGAPVSDVICHPASPLLVLVTPRGLLRLHCFAHSIAVIETPWAAGQALAQLVNGEDISLLGVGEADDEPWRVTISGTGAHLVAEAASEPPPEPPPASSSSTAADKLREMRANQQQGVALPVAAAPVYEAPRRTTTAKPDWRDPLVQFGHEVARGGDQDVPLVPVDNELGDLAHRLRLGGPARRALACLYALHLVGETGLPIARLVRATGDWSEALGKGELGALALLDKTVGKVALRRPVVDLLDGTPPRIARLVGAAPTTPRAGAFRIGRDGRTDAEIEAALTAQLGRLALIDELDDLDDGLLEARIHGATAVAFAAPPHRPRPWPRDAGLVLVLPGSATAWLADLPSLTSE